MCPQYKSEIIELITIIVDRKNLGLFLLVAFIENLIASKVKRMKIWKHQKKIVEYLKKHKILLLEVIIFA